MDFLSMLQGGFNPQQTRQVQQIQPTRNPQKTLNVMKSDTVNPQAGRQLQMAPSQGMRRPMAQPMGRAISQGPMKPRMPFGSADPNAPRVPYGTPLSQIPQDAPRNGDFMGQDPRQFKMYEDMSFQGDPRQFIQQNPGYTFYEDGKFSAPQQQPQFRQPGLPENMGPNTPVFDQEREQEFLNYGGIGRGQRSQAQDPMAILRSLLGL